MNSTLKVSEGRSANESLCQALAQRAHTLAADHVVAASTGPAKRKGEQLLQWQKRVQHTHIRRCCVCRRGRWGARPWSKERAASLCLVMSDSITAQRDSPTSKKHTRQASKLQARVHCSSMLLRQPVQVHSTRLTQQHMLLQCMTCSHYVM
jgi:hypothetical protein